MKLKTGIFAVLALAVVGVLAWLALAPVERPAPKAKAAEKVERKVERKAKGISKAKPRKPATARKTVTNRIVRANAQAPVGDWIDKLTGKDKEIAQKVSDALDAEDWTTIKGLARDAAASKNPEVRQQMVDALGWFGPKAIADLTVFLGDRNKEVSESAFSQWDSAVDQVEDEVFRVTVAKEAMKSLKDPDMLDNVSTKLKSAEDEPAAVDAILDILRSVKEDSDAAKVAKESYEFVTGEEFTSVGAASLWKIKRAQEQKEEDNQ